MRNLLGKTSHRGWGWYLALDVICIWTIVQSFQYPGTGLARAIAIGSMILFAIQLIYPTMLGWLLSMALLVALCFLFLFDPFHNLGPGRKSAVCYGFEFPFRRTTH
jgi:hypothetical protein